MPQDPPAPSGQSLPPGTRLEEFEVESVLGSGGFGITYLASDMSLNRKVVIKENLPAQFAFRDRGSGTVCPRAETGEDSDNFAWSLRNFLREADTLASLDHPGIVKVLRQFEANGTAYFVMPFEEGTALDVQVDDRKESGTHFTEEELRGLLWYMLGALEHLHERGIYHRDIKPGNILITHEGVPVLIDFGSARQRLSEHSMTVVESAGYTPFEQLQSRGNVGPWSDIYALGATLAKAITYETPVKTVDRVGNDPWQPLATRPGLAQRYSQGFLAGIDRALAVDLQARWQDARQWREGVWGEAQTPPPLQVPQPAGKASRLVVPGPVSQVPQPAGPASRLVMPGSVLRESLVSNRKVQFIAGSVLAVVLVVVVLLMVSQSNHEEELARIAAEEQQAEEKQRQRRVAAKQKAEADLAAKQKAEADLAAKQKAEADLAAKKQVEEKRKRREVAVNKALELVVPGKKFLSNFFDLVDRDALKSAAEAGDARVQYVWGRLHDSSLGLLNNEEEAVRWYRKSAEQDYLPAQNNLGVMHANGRGVTKDEAEAMKWFRLAADQDYASAQNALGEMYFFDKGVNKSEAEAVKWFRKAAEQDYAPAQHNLGYMYSNGLVVTKDEAEAVKWYHKAADQDYAPAQFNLGLQYEGGFGVPKSIGAAVKWYRKAAAQGQTDAKAVLLELGYPE